MEIETNEEDALKVEAVEVGRFLYKQPITVIVDYWFYEFYEKRKAQSFIASKGLYEEYAHFRSV